MDLSPVSSALFSFLGATSVRLFLTHIIDHWKTRQEHDYELARIKVQDQVEQNVHDRNLQALRVQKELGVLEVATGKAHELVVLDNARFDEAVADIKKPTKWEFLDKYNSFIRPALATFCILAWGISLHHRGWILSTWDLELISATLGVFVGSRIHSTGR